MNRAKKEVETKVTIKPNCKDVVVTFEEGGDAGFGLTIYLTPEQTVVMARRLIQAAEKLGVGHGTTL